MKYKSRDWCKDRRPKRHLWRDTSNVGKRVQTCSRCGKERKLNV